MPAGEDIYQTIGFILEVKDLASAIATKAQRIIDTAASGVETSLSTMTASIESANDAAIKALDPMKESVVGVGTSFQDAFGAGGGMNAVKMFGERIIPAMAEQVVSAGETISSTFSGVPKAWDTVKTFFEKDMTFEKLRDGVAAVGKSFLAAVLPAKKLEKSIHGSGIYSATMDVIKVFGKFKTAAVATYTGVNQLFQTVLGLTKSAASLGKQGLMGMLLGPLGPILTLLSPIINALTKAFEPALETLGDLIDAVFAPFAGILDTVMQSLMPLIQKALGPLVSLLELGAVQVGVFLQGLTDTADTGGMLGGIIDTLAPAFSALLDGLMQVGKALLPVIGHLIETLVPIITKVIGIVAKAVAKLLPVIASVIEKTLPKLIDAIGHILDAVVPLIEPLLNLGVVLAEKVFAPLLVTTIGLIADGIEAVAKFLTEDVIPVVVPFIEDVTKQVDDFYSNFSKNMSDLYILFLKPIIDWFTDDLPAMFSGAFDAVGGFLSDVMSTMSGWWDDVTDFFSKAWDGLVALFDFSGLGATVGGIFDGIVAALKAPLEMIASFVNDYILTPLNSIIDFLVDAPLIGKAFKALGLSHISPIALAEGGIVSMPTIAAVGEVNPEAVVPLDADSITKFVQPIVAANPGAVLGQMPELGAVTKLLGSIESLLKGTLKVKIAEDGGDASAGRSGGGRSGEDRDLDAAVGADGMSWAAA